MRVIPCYSKVEIFSNFWEVVGVIGGGGRGGGWGGYWRHAGQKAVDQTIVVIASHSDQYETQCH